MIEFFFKGGPVMWPILILGLVTLAALLERVFFYLSEQSVRNPKLVQKIFELTEKGKYEEAIAIGEKSKFVVAQVLVEGLRHRNSMPVDAMIEAASAQIEKYSRGLVILDTAVTLGPLLGLLGTVTGMMHAFSIVGTGEIAGKQAAITGGVAESLIAVSFGLAIAIIAIIPLNFFNARTEKVRREIEGYCTRLEMILKKSLKVNNQRLDMEMVR
ncbi:biopolymer transporter [Methylacidiphilum kamchatkense Kam1]|uniref:Biopolymer transporter n=1 Tax=Methylacidiphilum kamchatkense Kam1 TaxID=1202785 RepID=A0A0C1RV20_9BACT|nr:MotA/TolQ/ExbB proton channel family protein [Methylacidiphilum kamchatkense]KIE58791.1 biopolymer transporter [Methylacidiphilum kamchatkense Kam1]QDQ41800.1 outer membrane transport energization protein ExbB [Methylacidiphilum kamchatkense Kam1]